ncbi:MAG: branched-chain amino acid ABC transporter permease, partial [Chloroflexota bacterium]|nr:branched-chain amino acid ABC transporter permease [Chloroflexota bacterium]
MKARQWGPALLTLVVLAALPRMLPTDTTRSLLLDVAMYTMLALGLQLVMGYAGQISLGQGAFFAIGAYGYGLLAVKLGVSPWLAVLVAALANVAIGYAIGLPILRLTGQQLALATIAFAFLVYWVSFQATKVTGGP